MIAMVAVSPFGSINKKEKRMKLKRAKKNERLKLSII